MECWFYQTSITENVRGLAYINGDSGTRPITMFTYNGQLWIQIQQIGATQIGTPTGIATFGNQSSVNTANALQMMSGLLSNLANAGSQASAKKYNSAEAAAERAFQKEMRGTAYQDTAKDMIAAGINPILAATNGATSTPSGASASIGSQHYNQQSAQAASVSAMYEYGNNTAELADKYLQLAKQATVS